MAAAAAVNSNVRTVPLSYPHPPPLREVTNVSLPPASVSSQGPKLYSLSTSAHPSVEREDEEVRQRHQMMEMQELDTEILQLEEMLKKAANGFL